MTRNQHVTRYGVSEDNLDSGNLGGKKKKKVDLYSHKHSELIKFS